MTYTAEAPPRPARLDPDLLAASPGGLGAVAAQVRDAIEVASSTPRAGGPLPAGRPGDVLAAATGELGLDLLPEDGIGATAALQAVASVLARYGIDLSHPASAAHLQPPALAVAVAADTLASATNASLDTYDSGPATIAVERQLIGSLARLARLGPHADGVFTPGGSLSNLLALLLARDAAAARLGIDVRSQGVAALPRPVVFCSEIAHFSVHRACAALGLGEDAVVPVPVDATHRMRPDALDAALRELGDATPIAVVATAGSTDFGSIDPLPQIAGVCAEYDVWLHVDAAYGFGTLFSDRLAPRLAGIELADSITLDLHKIGWQPAAASVVLVSDAGAFGALDRQVNYLNPVDDIDAGYDGLLGRSLQTTRRPDAVKVAATVLAHGRRGLGVMVDACHDLAQYAQHRITTEAELELVAPAELTTVVFRHRGGPESREITGALRRRLLETGRALIGRTTARGPQPGSAPRPCLKFTLLNPTATPNDIDRLVDTVLEAGRECLAARP